MISVIKHTRALKSTKRSTVGTMAADGLCMTDILQEWPKTRKMINHSATEYKWYTLLNSPRKWMERDMQEKGAEPAKMLAAQTT